MLSYVFLQGKHESGSIPARRAESAFECLFNRGIPCMHRVHFSFTEGDDRVCGDPDSIGQLLFFRTRGLSRAHHSQLYFPAPPASVTCCTFWDPLAGLGREC